MLKKMQNMLNDNKKGFSLIELIVVIAIIGILVMLAAPRFLGYTKDANVAAMKADVKILSDAAMLYNIDNVEKGKAWPTDDTAVDQDTEAITLLKAQEGNADIQVVKLDADELTLYVKNTKNKLENYGLVISAGEHQGEVFHLDGVENKEGITFFGKVLQKDKE